MEQTITVIRKETAARVIVMGVNPTTPRIEAQLPGTAAAIVDTNAALMELCARLSPSVLLVDPANFLGDAAPTAVPDGIHYSAEGHRRVAAHLVAMLAQPASVVDARGS
jgi:hypothetical protein